ncbi:hypothetical protein RWE15_04845 [Virgibacillus halophilus]|uniref:Uncharacterized protein n=1 Tax=Tigheibacillus halophilus TaxID=361280 RepID=A0ABU5C3L4_9BACI|nr:hypothetical protein [Virgibacillus halophilus]
MKKRWSCRQARQLLVFFKRKEEGSAVIHFTLGERQIFKLAIARRLYMAKAVQAKRKKENHQRPMDSIWLF